MLLRTFPSPEGGAFCLASGAWPLDNHDIVLHPQDLDKLRVPAFGFVSVNICTDLRKASAGRQRSDHDPLRGENAEQGRREGRQDFAFFRAIPDDEMQPGDTCVPVWFIRETGLRPTHRVCVARAFSASEAPACVSRLHVYQVPRKRTRDGKPITTKTGTKRGHTVRLTRALSRRLSGCLVRVGSLLAAEVLGETIVLRVVTVAEGEGDADTDSAAAGTPRGEPPEQIVKGTGSGGCAKRAVESQARGDPEANDDSCDDASGNRLVTSGTHITLLDPPHTHSSRTGVAAGERQESLCREVLISGTGGSASRCSGNVNWTERAPGLQDVLQEVRALILLSIGGLRITTEQRGHQPITAEGEHESMLEWSRILPAGILLCGPSGVGKSLALDLLSADLRDTRGLHVVHLLGPQILASSDQSASGNGDRAIPSTLGGSLGNAVREIEAHAPALLVLDELDVLLDAAGGDEDQAVLGEGSRACTMLLLALDYLASTEGVAVLGATRRSPGGTGGAGWAGPVDGDGTAGDRAAAMPPAFTKPGRFDRCVVLSAPTQLQREEILRGMLVKRGWRLESLTYEALGSDDGLDAPAETGRHRSASSTCRSRMAAGSSASRDRFELAGVLDADPAIPARLVGDTVDIRSKSEISPEVATVAAWVTRLGAITPGMVGGDLKRLVHTARARAAQREAKATILTPDSLARMLGNCQRTAFTSRQVPPRPPSQAGSLKTLTWSDVMGAVAVTVPRALRGMDVTSAAGRGPSWDCVGGFSEARRRLQRLVQWPWLHPEAFARMGIAPPAGALLYGPSGCGKSLVAQVLATECLANFVWVRSSELLSRYLGETEAKLRALFAKARSAAPCILFLDEIDAITVKRGDPGEGGGAGHGEGAGGVHARVLSTLLNEMDGVAGSVTARATSSPAGGGGGVLVLAATNRRNALDSALLRPGRLHESVELGMPRREDREGVLRVHARPLPLSQEVDLTQLSQDDVSGGLSCADLEAACRDAAMIAIRQDVKGADEVRPEHLKRALEERATSRLRSGRFTFSLGVRAPPGE